MLVNFTGILWGLMKIYLESTLSSSEKSTMLFSLLPFSTSWLNGKSREIKILWVSAMKPNQSHMFWQHILYKCFRVQNLVNLKFPQTYKLIETYRLKFDSKLAVQLGVMSKCIELPFLGENIVLYQVLTIRCVWKLNKDCFIKLERDRSKPASTL